MAQTVANLADVLKEVWTSDRVKKQFYDKNPFLDAIYKGQYEVSKARIGEKAIVPIHKGRSGGYTSTTSAGGALNPPDEQKVDAAEYTLVYHWFQISLETGALNQAASSKGSAVVAKSLEIEGAINDTRKQCMRQIVTNSDGIIAACDSGGASATVELLTDSATSYGYQAIRRGWLYPGLKVDIGATGNTDSIVAGAEIVSVKKSASDPDITIDSSVSTTAGTDFVYVANPNSGTAANPELNGLRSMVGSSTSALGGLDPDNAGEEFWQPARVDTTTTVWSIDLALDLQADVFQETGEYGGYILTSAKQQRNFYSYLQNQVRFSGEGGLGAGNVTAPKWNGMEVHALPDVLDQDWYHLTLEDLVIAQGEGIPEPTWVSDLQGINRGLQWIPDTTRYQDAIVWPWQLGMTQRNRSAAAIGLTA
jgi:hypothetical protein